MGAAVAPQEAFLELAGGRAATRVQFTALLQPGLCETDDYPAKQAQGKGRFGIADAAVILAQGDVQSVVQAAFDGPITALEFEQARRIQLVQGEAADEINELSAFLALAPNPPPEPGNGLNPGEAHLLRRGFPAIQHPDFASAPVVLPRQGVGARRGRRGKNAVG